MATKLPVFPGAGPTQNQQLPPNIEPRAPRTRGEQFGANYLLPTCSGIFGYINYLVEKDRKWIVDTLINGMPFCSAPLPCLNQPVLGGGHARNARSGLRGD